MNYDTVFVDWDKTLSHSRFWEHWAADPSRQQNHELIQNRFFRSPPFILDDWMRGKYTAESAVQEVARRTGIVFDTLFTGLVESCVQMQANTQALGLMNTLRERGTRVVIATDNMDTFSRWTIPNSGIEDHCDAILVSYGLRALKKDKHPDGSSVFFGAYLEKHDLDPSRTLLIDDSPRNAVVEEFGMHYAQVAQVRPVTAILGELVRKGV